MENCTEPPRLAVIGTGFLMTYLDRCIKLLAGTPSNECIVGFSRSEASARRKSAELGYPVTESAPLPVLKKFAPDILLFSPPPAAAEALTETVLMPYYASVRSQGAVCPDLYVFPPNPTGSYYRSKLGDDVNIVNLLPNMATIIDGRDISQQSYSVTVFPSGSVWPPENLDRLARFLSPIGTLLTVPEEHSGNMLGAFVASHLVQEYTMAITAGLHSAGIDTSFACVAGVMRFHLLLKTGRHFPDALPCRLSGTAELDAALERALDAWISGMRDFSVSRGMSVELSDAVCIPQLDIFLQSAQSLSQEDIGRSNSQHATKGGLLERGLEYFTQSGAPVVEAAFSKGAASFSNVDHSALRVVSFELSREIWLRGQSMAEN